MTNDFEGILNFRDLGGMATTDGHLVRNRRLLRSAALSDATEGDIARLVDGGLRVIIDLRAGFEMNSAPDPEIPGVERIECPMVPARALGIGLEDGNFSQLIRGSWSPDEFDVCAIYRSMFEHEVAESWRTIFDTLRAVGDGGVLWHCTNGKDRTGLVAAVIELALGVPRDAVMADYLATNAELEQRRAEIRSAAAESGEEPSLFDQMGPLLEAKPEYLNAALAKLDEEYDGIQGFLEDVCACTLVQDGELHNLYLQ